jgi:RNA polymerase sigma factor (sigma-70 family)
MPFSKRPRPDFDRLSDEELVAYAVAARDAGEFEAMREALAALVMRYEKDVVARARKKLPEAEAEDIAMKAIGQAIFARFDGSSKGEFLAIVYRILARRIADYYEKQERSLDTEKLPDEHHGEDNETWGPDAATTEDETGRAEVQDLIDRCLEKLSAPHVRTVELYVFDGYSAEETADQVNTEFPDLNPEMTADNVHKIASRFRKDLRKALEDDGEPGSPD